MNYPSLKRDPSGDGVTPRCNGMAFDKFNKFWCCVVEGCCAIKLAAELAKSPYAAVEQVKKAWMDVPMLQNPSKQIAEQCATLAAGLELASICNREGSNGHGRSPGGPMRAAAIEQSSEPASRNFYRHFGPVGYVGLTPPCSLVRLSLPTYPNPTNSEAYWRTMSYHAGLTGELRNQIDSRCSPRSECVTESLARPPDSGRDLFQER